MSTTIGLRLDDETKERLANLGKVKDRSSHWMMKKAIDDYLAREEQYEREKAEDQARWDSYVATGSVISNDDMMGWLEGLAKKAHDAT